MMATIWYFKHIYVFIVNKKGLWCIEICVRAFIYGQSVRIWLKLIETSKVRFIDHDTRPCKATCTLMCPFHEKGN